MDEPFHMVPVPQSRMTEVYALLGAVPEPAPAREASYEVPDEGGSWTINDLSRLYKKCNSTLIAVVGDIARRCMAEDGEKPELGGPSTQVTMVDAGQPVYADGEFTRIKLRAQLSWLSKHSQAIKGTKCWPIYFEHDFGVAYYHMPLPLAEAWLSFMADTHVVAERSRPRLFPATRPSFDDPEDD